MREGDTASARSADDICMSWRSLRGGRWPGPRRCLIRFLNQSSTRRWSTDSTGVLAQRSRQSNRL